MFAGLREGSFYNNKEVNSSKGHNNHKYLYTKKRELQNTWSIMLLFIGNIVVYTIQKDIEKNYLN